MPDREKIYGVTDRIIEYGIYLYILLMFLAKGEGIRNIIIFGNFFIWVLTLKHRSNLYLLKKPVSIFSWTCLVAIIFSVIFSRDPLYSLHELKGDPLKFALLFPVIATVMAEPNRLKKACVICFVSLVVIVSAAYYSYFFHPDLEMLKPDTVWVHAWHTKFAQYLCMLMPLSFVLFAVWNKFSLKVILAGSLILSVIALVLSTARGGYLAFIAVVLVWAVYLSKTKGYNINKILFYSSVIALIIGSVAFFYLPGVKQRLLKTSTLNDRIEIWETALYAVEKKPLWGWGYGDRFFLQEEPYKDSKAQGPPNESTHNTFVKILFHQGIAGLVSYVLLIFTAIKSFWKGALSSSGVVSYVLAACVSVLIGNYIFNAMLEDQLLVYLAVVLGLGLAASSLNSMAVVINRDRLPRSVLS